MRPFLIVFHKIFTYKTKKSPCGLSYVAELKLFSVLVCESCDDVFDLIDDVVNDIEEIFYECHYVCHYCAPPNLLSSNEVYCHYIPIF